MELSAVEAGLARRLRAEREARDWTLAELAIRSGVSRAMLSKIERGEASPTASLLGRLSGALGLTLSQLFARIEDNGQDNGQLARAATQPVWRDPETGFLRRSLTPSVESSLDLMWGELPAGAKITYPPAAYAFIAEQQLVMIDGALTIWQGETMHELNAGDCLRFGPAQGVTFHNAGAVGCRYIIAILRTVDARPDMRI
jgi:transcriptional regulator with XRE-family HTH domain